MTAGQLGAYFQANKPVILGTAAAAVAGLALLQKKKKTTAPAAAVTAGATVPGTIPAAAVVSSGVGYDSSSSDLYNALQPQLEQILQTTSRSGINSAPAPVASNLFSPTYNGRYVQLGSSINEIESDGSMYGLSPTEWDQASALPNRPSNFSFQILGPNDGTSSTPYSTKTNLLTKNTAAGG